MPLSRSTPEQLRAWNRRAAKKAQEKRVERRQRSTDRDPPQRRSAPSRRTAVRKVNPARKAQRFVIQFLSDERVKFFQALPCEVTGVVDPELVKNCHVTKGRGAGGTYRDIAPILHDVHTDFDTISEVKFERKYGRTKQSVKDRVSYYNALWDEYVAGRAA